MNTLLEGGQKKTLAELQAAAITRERVDSSILNELIRLGTLAPEVGEKDTLHQILLHLDCVEESVANANRIGLDHTAHLWSVELYHNGIDLWCAAFLGLSFGCAISRSSAKD